MHGTPSGLDNTTSCYGGVLRYQRVLDDPAAPSSKFTFLPPLPEGLLRILVTNTKVPRSTKQLVAHVRELKEQFGSIFHGVFSAVEAISLEFLSIVESVQLNADSSSSSAIYERVVRILHYMHWRITFSLQSKLVQFNQSLLEIMEVSHSSLETVKQISAAHHFPSKLTGAGGGGCAITLLPPVSHTQDDSSVISLLSQQLRYEA